MVKRRSDCPGCGHKKNLTAQEIEDLIARQLELEVDLVPDEIRDQRLQLCGDCPSLSGATCLKCGCFAKFRASLSPKKCPIGKW